jgi:uncharacterized membrane protein YqjE
VAAASPGLFDSLRHLAHTALGLAQTRLELFGSELEEEKLRLFDVLWQVALALLLLGLALVLLLGFVVLLFWDGYRLPAVAVLTLLFGGVGLWLLLRARALLRASEGGPFALSLAELRRDRDALLPPDRS